MEFVVGEYIRSLSIVAVISGIFIAIAPEGHLQKYIKYLVSLAVVLVLLSPLGNVIAALPSLGETLLPPDRAPEDTAASAPSDMEQKIIDQTRAAIESSVRDRIAAKFSIAADEISVTLSLDTTDVSAIQITKITVSLRDYAMWANSGEIARYITEMFGCETEVINK